MSRTCKLRIARNGTVTAIYDDRLKGLFEAFGQPIITRASFVEPDKDGNWTADLAPSGGPVLGPFRLREQALAAEHAWLEEHLFHAQGESTNPVSSL